ncbi:hypothetical protein [Demequina phytophila]|uniref:hypothetical protein n=1 Tax=Demequina phytophila TaxID=1638981 RepID=UPI00078454CF|nr:hypothetical protein [Demequina phytophila]
MGPSRYRALEAALPWIGEGMLPRRVTVDDARAVSRAEDPVALGLMLAYARSYAGALGGVVMGVASGGVLALAGRRRAAAWALGGAGLAALAVIEARRRARRWEALIEARLALLAGEAR